MTPDQVIAIIREIVQQEGRREHRLATVDSVAGGTFVRFDGESLASPTSYETNVAYTPGVGHRVVMERVGHTWVVAYRVG